MAAEIAPITELMGTYLDLPSTRERYFDLALLATELHLNQSEGSSDTEVQGISVVPVNAHWDGTLVWDALQSRVNSLGSKYSPRTQTILSLYDLPGVFSLGISEAEDAVRTFTKENEDFPLSFCKTTYPLGAPMTTIRGDLTDSGLLWFSQLGRKRLKPTVKDDFCIISNTIDETGRTPGYEDKIIKALSTAWTVAVRGVVEYNPSGYPNVDKALSWLGLPLKSGIEINNSNLAVSLRKVYMSAKGYGHAGIPHEGRVLLRRAGRSKRADSKHEPIKVAANAVIVSSGQLLVDAALNGIAPWDVPLSPDVRIPRRAAGDQDVSDEMYQKWISQYQLNLLSYGGQEVLLRRGKAGLKRFIGMIEETRLKLGEEASSEPQLAKALQMVVEQGELSKKKWPRALQFLL